MNCNNSVHQMHDHHHGMVETKLKKFVSKKWDSFAFIYLKIDQIEFISVIISTIFHCTVISNEESTVTYVGIARRRDHAIVHTIGEITIFIAIDGSILKIPISTDDDRGYTGKRRRRDWYREGERSSTLYSRYRMGRFHSFR